MSYCIGLHVLILVIYMGFVIMNWLSFLQYNKYYMKIIKYNLSEIKLDSTHRKSARDANGSLPPQTQTYNTSITCSIRQPQHNRVHEIEYRGRMANNMIQYLFARIIANRYDSLPVYSGPPLYWDIKAFPNMKYNNKTICSRLNCFCGSTDTCSRMTHKDKYKQNYLFYDLHRDTALHIFQPSQEIIHSIPHLGKHDIVIHLRGHDHHPRSDISIPHTKYFTTIIDSNLDETSDANIYLATEPFYRQNHHIIDNLRKKYGKRVIVSRGSPAQDMVLGMRASIMIGTFGTFSWMMAYLSKASRIYLVYNSARPRGSYTCPFHRLFIHNDPRIRYYDTERGANVHLETSNDILSRRGSTFFDNIRNRTNECNPKINNFTG